MTAKDKDRENLLKIKEKSDDDFEKNITYISAGALGLSMTFIEKIVDTYNATFLFFLFAAWGLLTFTLLVNLLSHYLSSYYHDKSTEELDNNNPTLSDKIDSRNKQLRRINITTVISLILGIICLILFVSINLTKMKDEKSKNETTTSRAIIKTIVDKDYEKLGRTITKPVSTNSGSKGTTKDSSNQIPIIKKK
jgi:hypothetical protein